MQKTKIRLAIAAIAILAASAANLTSCNKDDESLNNEPAMVQKSGPGIENAEKILIAKIRLEYRHYDPINKVEICTYRPKSLEFCNMELAVSNHDFSFPVSIKMDQNGVVKSLLINETDMPLEDKPTFEDCVTVGTISFASDSPILDSELQTVVANDYIEAGTYPIQKLDGVYVITISE
ncbi:MAG: hypothetical protein IKD33_07140 [Bacteroidales bacterium]|nr:hypothetical protein [Bacteroidales bacterium]